MYAELAVSEANPAFPGVNVSGYITSELGLGEAARSTIRSLEAMDIPVAINNCTLNAAHRKLDSSYQTFSDENPYPVNLIQVNPDLISQFFEDVGPAYFKDKYNIGCWAWELLTLPESWQASLHLFHEIWTCSNYCAEAIARVSPVPVVKIPLNIALPPPTVDRAALGLPPDKFIFLFMFDFCSVFERKNPLAVVHAFQQVAATHPEALLVLKFSNAQQYPQQFKQLQAAMQNHPAIHVIDGYLLKQEVNALLYHCDCYVSLHRSEGFGFTMAEAMYYGKPVIATGFSGNLDFMTVGNSLLVKYDLVTLAQDYGPYQKGNVWADPDITHAAERMRYVIEHPQAAQAIGSKAAQDIRAQFSPVPVGQVIQQRLAAVQKHTANFTSFSKQDSDQLRLQAELQRSLAKLQLLENSKLGKLHKTWQKLKPLLKRTSHA